MIGLTLLNKTLDSGYIIGVYTYSYGAGSVDILIAKLDSSGNCDNCPLISSVSPNISSVNPTILNFSPSTSSPSPTIQSITPNVQYINPSRSALNPK